MKITIYELLGLIKNGKAPKKIKINDSTLFLSKINGIRYRFEECGSLNWDYYIETNILDAPVEILDKDFKLEEEQDIEHYDYCDNPDVMTPSVIANNFQRLNEDLDIIVKAVNELKNGNNKNI